MTAGDEPHQQFTFTWWGPPEDLDDGFDRGEPTVGLGVLSLALSHDDPQVILPRVARALASTDPQIRHQGKVSLAHVARLHRTTDRRCLDLLRDYPRGNEADDDLWQFVPRHRLPWWLWRYQAPCSARHWLIAKLHGMYDRERR